MKKTPKLLLCFMTFFLFFELILRLFPFMSKITAKTFMVFSTDKGFRIENRVIPRDHFLFVRDYYLFWKVKYISKDVFHAINKLGFRGKAVSRIKPQGVFRIFVIGDSCVFGNALEYTQAYPFYLEELLKRTKSNVTYEVVNAGVPGYSSLQGLRHLERDILSYQPDLVIASFGWNDTWPAIFYTDKEQKSPYYLSTAIYSALQHSAVFLYLENIVSSSVSKMRAVLPKNDKKIDKIDRVPEEDFIENLTAIAALGRKKHFKVIFLNQPTRKFTEHYYGRLMRKVSAEQGTMFLDLLTGFQASGYTWDKLFMDGNHYLPLGNQIIAKTIYNFLKDKQLVEGEL